MGAADADQSRVGNGPVEVDSAFVVAADIDRVAVCAVDTVIKGNGSAVGGQVKRRIGACHVNGVGYAAGRVAAEFGKFPVVREYVDGSVGPDGAAGRFRRIVLQAGVVNVKHAGIFDETAGVGSKTFNRGDVVDGGLLACRN